jgi:hypothetical protein
MNSGISLPTQNFSPLNSSVEEQNFEEAIKQFYGVNVTLVLVILEARSSIPSVFLHSNLSLAIALALLKTAIHEPYHSSWNIS